MFKEAKFKLTLIYSALFLAFFWVFSFSLYYWISNSFGDNYVSQVQEQKQTGQFEGEPDDKSEALLLNIAGQVAIVNLRNMLLILNAGLLIVIPAVAWILTLRTLRPLQQIHEQQKQFVSDVSHELRTPLSIISGEMEIALKKSRTSKEYIEVLSSSKQEVGSLIDLVENLLFLARGDQKAVFLRYEKVDITDILNSTVSSLKEKINNKKIIIKFKPPEDSVSVNGQASMLKQLFLNIIDNAIIYTPENGAIDIALDDNIYDIVIRVADTGIGMKQEDQKNIFDRFYRVDKSRSQTKGYGLGLAICQSIVTLHKGQIEINSKPQKGTTVAVHLPKS